MKNKGKGMALLILFVTLLWLLASCEAPQPEVKYGEFPFEIVLEINGETKVISDVYVCEYDGIGVGSNGPFIKWKGYMKSTGEENIILMYDDNKEICCSVGSAEYYMNDPDHIQFGQNFPKVFYKKPHDMGGVSYGGISESELLAKYKIKIVSWTLSDPIENAFA